MDIKLIFLIVILSYATAAIVLFILWKQQKTAGVVEWALFFTGQAVGNIFIGIRPVIGHFLSVTFGNLIIVGSSYFITLGLSGFFKRKLPTWYNVFTIILLTVMTLLFQLFPAPVAEISKRTLIAGSSQSILFALSLLYYFKELKKEDRRRFPVFGWLMSIELLLLSYRTISILFYPYEQIFPFNQVSSYLLVLLNDVSIIFYTVPIIMLVHRTLISELLNYQNNLEELVKARSVEVLHVEKLASLGHISAGLAHEINNPNNNIRLGCEYLSSGLKVLSSEQIKSILPKDFRVNRISLESFLQEAPIVALEILDNSSRVDEIIRSLTEYASPANREKVKTLELNNTIDNSISLVRKYAKEYTNRFEVKINSKPLYIKSVSNKIEHIVINLIQNACHSLTSKEQMITISTGEDGDFNYVKIEDEGCGILPENLKSIFDPFFSTRRRNGGTGLGLAVVKRLVSEIHALIKVDSVPNLGTTFMVLFKKKEM